MTKTRTKTRTKTKTKTTDELSIEYWPLDKVKRSRWDENAKRHNLDDLIASFHKYGFRDPIGYDKTLGAFVEGNGRAEALEILKKNGDKPPRGLRVDSKKRWLVPILVGNDAATIHEAKAYAIDHNNLVFGGSNIPINQILSSWEPERFAAVVVQLRELQLLPISLDEEDADFAIRRGTADFGPENDLTNPGMNASDITCPNCGHIFKG